MALPVIKYNVNGRTVTADQAVTGLAGVVIKTEPEQNALFYRRKLKGEITFAGYDYELFWNLHQQTCCQTVGLSVYRQSSACTDYDAFWSGTFNLSDMEFDTERGTATVSAVTPDDGYNHFLRYWSRPVNWMEIPVNVQVYNYNMTVLYDRGRWLTSVLAGMCGLALSGTKGESLIPFASSVSTFLTAPVNPVTRKKSTTNRLICIQASDFLVPMPKGGDKVPRIQSTVATLTLKELCEDLAELYNIYPHIDPDTGQLRWEHISYYPQLAYDVPQAGFSLPADNAAWTGKKTIKTDTSSLYSLYTLTIQPNLTVAEGYLIREPGTNQQGTFIDFQKGSIEFEDECVTVDAFAEPLTKDRSVKRICTDVYAAESMTSAVDRDNWIMLAEGEAVEQGVFQLTRIAAGTVEIANALRDNGNQAASTLINLFHRHEQPFVRGLVNRDPAFNKQGYKRSMRSVAPIRTLKAATVSYCCTDQPVYLNKSIQSWYGPDGRLKSAEYNVATGQLTIEIVHPGPCQVQPDGPFVPDDPPNECPPRGEWIREETQVEYSRSDPSRVCAQSTAVFYTDGQCGEYSDASVMGQYDCE